MIRRRAPRRGYTIVEVMIAITLLVLGIVGIVAMQHYTAVSNRNARMIATANHIARTWVERLRTDSLAWNHPSSVQPGLWDLGDTAYLSVNGPAGLTAMLDTSGGPTSNWARPNYNAVQGWGAAADAFGNDVPESGGAYMAGTNPPVFCTEYRLTWLYGPTSAATPNGPPFLVRAEVRVFWIKEGATPLPGSVYEMRNFCVANNETNISNLLDREVGLQYLHTIYAATTLRQNTAVSQ